MRGNIWYGSRWNQPNIIGKGNKYPVMLDVRAMTAISQPLS